LKLEEKMAETTAALDVLAFGAHPDDVELMCGGTIIRLVQLGYRVGMISLTAGEMGTRGTPEGRDVEFRNAAEVMNLAAAKKLDIADGFVSVTRENKLKVIEELRCFRPKIVFLPYWKTRHPDHGNCSNLVREACFLSGLAKIDTGKEQHRPQKLIYFMEHYDFRPSFIMDISASFEQKIKAIEAYRSQVFNREAAGDGPEQTYVSSPEFFQSILHRACYWGHKIGVQYGEPLLTRELVKITDPLSIL
jgi:N-acetylglucosamine malate deacetylase 1